MTSRPESPARTRIPLIKKEKIIEPDRFTKDLINDENHITYYGNKKTIKTDIGYLLPENIHTTIRDIPIKEQSEKYIRSIENLSGSEILKNALLSLNENDKKTILDNKKKDIQTITKIYDTTVFKYIKNILGLYIFRYNNNFRYTARDKYSYELFINDLTTIFDKLITDIETFNLKPFNFIKNETLFKEDIKYLISLYFVIEQPKPSQEQPKPSPEVLKPPSEKPKRKIIGYKVECKGGKKKSTKVKKPEHKSNSK